MFECGECGDRYWDRSDFYEHMNYEGHWLECETCERVFATEHQRCQHMNAVDHWKPQIPCETCDSVFFSERAVENHMDAKGHWKNYCHSCKLKFQNANNLQMHLNSKAHRGGQMSCPFCKKGFTTASGVSHHLERGTCPKARGVNRATILEFCRRSDSGGVFTNKMIQGSEEHELEYIANENSWNGDGYECYLCHRTFRLLKGLNQHLNSTAHQSNVYHCPNRGSCSKQFVTLASLFNHLESEGCGFMRFEQTQRAYEQATESLITGRRLTMF